MGGRCAHVRWDAPELGHGAPDGPVAGGVAGLLDGDLDDGHVVELVPEHELEGDEDAVVEAGAGVGRGRAAVPPADVVHAGERGFLAGL